jgi:hypothetical protein
MHKPTAGWLGWHFCRDERLLVSLQLHADLTLMQNVNHSDHLQPSRVASAYVVFVSKPNTSPPATNCATAKAAVGCR